MVTLTLERKRASQMMARTVLGSCPASLRVVHCKSVTPARGPFVSSFVIDLFSRHGARMQRDSGWRDDPGT